MKVKLNNGNQPPQNKILITVLITIILPYSPIKNKAKPIAEYSVLKPETNSPSASGKSKGCLLHSANNAIKKIINNGNNYQKNCFWKILLVFL